MKHINKISLLGPSGTFSEVACNKFLENNNLKLEKEFYPTIFKTAISTKDNELSILPFENTLEGYVFESMDYITNCNYQIIDEVDTKVSFAFLSNAKNIEDIKNVYVQFKSQGQCSNFLHQYDFSTIITQSNIESYTRLLESDETFGAIVPIYKASDDFSIKILNIEDIKNNYTRFLVLGQSDYLNKEINKASLWVKVKEERPGLLYELLCIFNDEKLNMTAIISRPTRTDLGKYNFYIEVSMKDYSISNLEKLVSYVNLHKTFEMKILGCY